MKATRTVQRKRRQKRVRKNIKGSADVPRLNVFRSAKHIYAQVIDDTKGVTLAAASTAGKQPVEKAGSITGAKKIGEMIAERAKAKKIEKVVFDRNGFRFHGRIKALADAAREKGLKF